MLHILKIDIEDRKRWGGIFQEDFALPSRIRKIRGFVVNVDEADTSRFRASKGFQTANVAISLNNTEVLTASTPAVSLSHTVANTVSKNKVTLSKQMDVPNGSVIRIIVDEVSKCPFVKATDSDVDDYFTSGEQPTNSYTIKVYLIYDK